MLASRCGDIVAGVAATFRGQGCGGHDDEDDDSMKVLSIRFLRVTREERRAKGETLLLTKIDRQSVPLPANIKAACNLRLKRLKARVSVSSCILKMMQAR
jgi:hypothetical protein